MSDIKLTPIKRVIPENLSLALDWFISEVVVSDSQEGYNICHLQQGTGHCCGATYITQMQPAFPEYIDILLDRISKFPSSTGLRWPVQKRLFFYLSEETNLWDKVIRKRPDVRELYTFKNFATRPYTGSDVTLFVLELK